VPRSGDGAQRRLPGVVVHVGVNLGARGESGVAAAAEVTVHRERQEQGEPPGAAAAKPDTAGGDGRVQQVAGGQHLPPVGDPGQREDLRTGGGVADPGPDDGPEGGRQRIELVVRPGQQMQLRVLTEQPTRPPIAGGRDRGQPAQGTGHARRLRVDHPRGDHFRVPVPVGASTRQAGPDLVTQPRLKLGQAGGDPAGALLRPAGRSSTVLGRGPVLAGSPLRSRDGPALAAGPPRPRVVGRLALLRHDTIGPGQQQRERVLTGELPGRAGAFACRAGQVDDGLIRVFAGPRAQSPEQLTGHAGTAPR